MSIWLEKEGDIPPALAGLPMLIKDNIDTIDFQTPAGTAVTSSNLAFDFSMTHTTHT
jgi:Asp-tRNA(Asn)/Glu-tRNA(Gln) amidotransferase A subunit family amidase